MDWVPRELLNADKGLEEEMAAREAISSEFLDRSIQSRSTLEASSRNKRELPTTSRCSFGLEKLESCLRMEDVQSEVWVATETVSLRGLLTTGKTFIGEVLEVSTTWLLACDRGVNERGITSKALAGVGGEEVPDGKVPVASGVS